MLIDNGAKINQMSYIYDETPLQEALSSGNLSIAYALISHGADLKVQNNQKKSPLEYSTLVAEKIAQAKADFEQYVLLLPALKKIIIEYVGGNCYLA